jgi:hypothetical protein
MWVFEKIKTHIRSAKADLRSMEGDLKVIRQRLHTLAAIERERFYKELMNDKKYECRERLEKYGFKVYSQYEEDGIIQEIFCRIGLRTKIFVEFGVENGLENNTLKLLLEGWRGLWIEGSTEYVSLIRSKFANVISEKKLTLVHAFLDIDNINSILQEYHTGEIDLLSIDIDGNDIYIFEKINAVNPRVVVIEYNGKFPPPMSIAQKYDPKHTWTGTDYGGSSLSAIVKIAGAKGYSLVGCTVAGVNAFFVRNDLVSDHFCSPFTAENHYHPARYFLWQTYVSGHPPDWGDYVSV